MSETAPEFFRPLSVARLPPNGLTETLEAKPDERAALALRFDLMEIKSLKAQLAVHPSSQGVMVSGKMQAEITQRCVVSLEPLPARIDLDIATHFIPAERHHEGAGPAEDIEDECEIFEGGKIDLGEMVAQHLGVNLDPYPRKPNAKLAKTEFGAKIEKPKPFATLAGAVKKQKNQDKTED